MGINSFDIIYSMCTIIILVIVPHIYSNKSTRNFYVKYYKGVYVRSLLHTLIKIIVTRFAIYSFTYLLVANSLIFFNIYDSLLIFLLCCPFLGDYILNMNVGPNGYSGPSGSSGFNGSSGPGGSPGPGGPRGLPSTSEALPSRKHVRDLTPESEASL
jgi:hypothetical protein